MANTAAYLKRAIATLNGLAMRPDLVLFTGDLTENGRPEEYARLRELLGHLHVRYALLPGNHDSLEALRDAFPAHRYLREHLSHGSFCIDVDDARVIALDSTHKGRQSGWVDGERLEWLAARLAERDDVPTLLALHHPPFATGVPVFDRQVFSGRAELERIVSAAPHVSLVIAGHVHTALQSEWAGARACTAPSTAPQFIIGRAPLGIGIESAGFLLHDIQSSGTATHVFRLHGARENELSA